MADGAHHDISGYGATSKLIHVSNAVYPTIPVSPPIYQTTSFRFPVPEVGAELAAASQPVEYYTRCGNPNNAQAEAQICDLENAEACLVVGSGMAAITTALLSNLKAGDHVIAQFTHYGCTLGFFKMLAGWGIEVTQCDPVDTPSFERAIKPNTKVIYTETPTNPTMEICDLIATAEIAKRHHLISITDNTFASSFNQKPLDLGYDIVVHSATKYFNGHSDVTAGVIASKDKPSIERAWTFMKHLGCCLHPFESWLLRRSLQTYVIRMEAHNRNAMEVAKFLEEQPYCEKVFYPGLPSHPQHEVAKRQMTGGYGAMMSFIVKGGHKGAYEFVRACKMCVLAVSLGSVETLISHPGSMIHSAVSDEEKERSRMDPALVRLSVGIENVEDIKADLAQAFEHVKETLAKDQN